MAKKFILALCVVLFAASAGWCIDPFKVNEGGFGPKIKGLQLGMKVTDDMPKKNIEVREDGRIRLLRFTQKDFGAEAMTYSDFAQAIYDNYNIAGLRWNEEANVWGVRYEDEGWMIVILGDPETIRRMGGNILFVTPIIIEAKFD